MVIDYKSAGVDVERGYKAVELIKKHIKNTYNQNVLGDVGSFGGVYSLDPSRKNPDCLVSGCDGVGTKLRYAIIANRHDTIGIDAVAMCVNDIVCHGAKPLFFLDYIAQAKLIPEKIEKIVAGIALGCKLSNCALIGGETAEMPDFYQKDDYDIAGFSCGIVKQNSIINPKSIEVGNLVIGLSSSGLHSNGFSLVRKLFGEDIEKLKEYNEFISSTLIDEFLTPTRIYVNTILDIQQKIKLKAVAHITGGGFIENIPRILNENQAFKLDRNSYSVPNIFKLIQEKSNMSDEQMYNTFNMGIGMVLVIDKADKNKIFRLLNNRENAYIIGEIVEGEGVIL